MRPNEKEMLLDLLGHEGAWCQQVEAQDAEGGPRQYDDPEAVAWDVTGALCRLFGWPRACVLFGQFDRHVHGRRASYGWPPRDLVLDAMTALQTFNDRCDTTFATIREQIASMPVWQGHERRLESV
ncbi:MAG: hypothetical protein C4547_00750 [Phycisphaerales bacterium]|nr:MAG: hypothetical protein C4547_00750 [Phycisphaerales bacterium]